MSIIGTIASSRKPATLALIVQSNSFATDGGVNAYAWSSGFSTKYAAPATSTGLNGNWFWSKHGVNQSTAKTEIVLSGRETPFLAGYPWSMRSGFGTKFSNPATLPSAGHINGGKFRFSGDVVAFGSQLTPYIHAYAWSSTGFGTKYSNPSTLATSAGFTPSWKLDGTEIVTGIDTSPRIGAWAWSNGFGTKRSDPATTVDNSIYSTDFNPGNDIAGATWASPYINIYRYTTGFGTKYSAPAALPSGPGASIKFNPAGNVVAQGSDNSVFLTAYPFTSGSGFGTRYTAPVTAPTGTVTDIQFSPDNTLVAIAMGTRDGLYPSGGTPWVHVYDWTNASGFGTKYANVSPAFDASGTLEIPSLTWAN